VKSFDPEWKNFHWSTKAGPNGQAMFGAMDDLVLLQRKPLLLQAISQLGGKDNLGYRMRVLLGMEELKTNISEA